MKILLPSFRRGLHPKIVWQVLLLSILSMATGIMLTQPLGPLFFLAILVLSVSVYLAYNYPVLTIILTIFLSLVAGNLKHINPIFNPVVDIGIFNLRLWDPLTFGVIITLLLKLFLNNNQLKTLLKNYPSLTMLFILLILQLFRSVKLHGINAPGELRTYYSYLFMVPYLVVFTKIPDQRLRMLKVLMFLSFSFILVALLKGLLAPKIALGVRYVNASGALAVLYGLIALFIARDRNLLKIGLLQFILISLAGGALIIFTAHRSVWLATAIALLTLYLLRETKLKTRVQIILTILIAGAIAYFGFSEVGYDPTKFLKTRISAFINPEQDPTAYWREYLWRESLKGIQQNPLLGGGLGRHFQLIGPGGELIATSPHNLYLTIPFQIGIPGLLLYLAFVGMLFLDFIRLRAYRAMPASDRSILNLGIVVLVAAHAYYMAYAMDWMSWTYVGLAASAVMNQKVSLISLKS